jgi:hypothetical protein
MDLCKSHGRSLDNSGAACHYALLLAYDEETDAAILADINPRAFLR